jgi:hypothetical protein
MRLQHLPQAADSTRVPVVALPLFSSHQAAIPAGAGTIQDPLRGPDDGQHWSGKPYPCCPHMLIRSLQCTAPAYVLASMPCNLVRTQVPLAATAMRAHQHAAPTAAGLWCIPGSRLLSPLRQEPLSAAGACMEGTHTVHRAAGEQGKQETSSAGCWGAQQGPRGQRGGCSSSEWAEGTSYSPWNTTAA